MEEEGHGWIYQQYQQKSTRSVLEYALKDNCCLQVEIILWQYTNRFESTRAGSGMAVGRENRYTDISATNESLFPLEAFGCTVEEIHRAWGSRIHKLVEDGSQKFAVYISEKLPDDFGTENVQQLAHFLWSMVQECPQDRKSTAVLLNHPFIVG